MTSSLYMLDTDTCIFLMRGESPTLAARVQAVPLERQVMSAMTSPVILIIAAANIDADEQELPRRQRRWSSASPYLAAIWTGSPLSIGWRAGGVFCVGR